MSVISAQERLRVTENILRHGNEFDMLEVTRPKGMLEYLVNMFTLGGVRKEKEELYNCVIKNLRNCFHENNITLNNLQNVKAINIFSKGMHIKFEPSARPEETRIVVKKGCEEESKLVPDHYFTSLCTSILLRDRLKLSHENDLLMPSGEINLTDIHKTNLSLPEVMAIMEDLPPQTKWIMSEEYNKDLDSLLSVIEQLDRNEKSAVAIASQVREQLGLNKNSDLLMPSGEINLTDIDETPLDLTEVISVLSNVPPQIKWTLSQEYIDNLNIVLRYSEFLEKNNNTKPFVSREPEPQVNILPKTSIHNETSPPVLSRETTGADSGFATGYMTGTNSDSDTLSIDPSIEERENLYSNQRSFKDILATRPNALITTKA